MPVVPTFSDYAPVPRLAESYLGARRLEQAERENLRATELGWARVGQEAASDLARTQVAREQIAANQVENEMRLKAQQDMLERNLLQDQQEANIKNAYDQIRLGLDERRIKNDEAIAAMRLKEAAESFTAQQEYNRMVEAGVPPDAAFRRTGFGQPGFPTALAAGVPKPATALRQTAQDRSLLYKDLVRQRDEVDLRFAGKRDSPEYQREMERINQEIKDLLQAVPRAGGVPLPAGSPTTSSTIGSPVPLGPPPVIPSGTSSIPLNPAFGMGPATNAPGPGLTIPSSLGATNRVRVLKITPRP